MVLSMGAISYIWYPNYIAAANIESLVEGNKDTELTLIWPDSIAIIGIMYTIFLFIKQASYHSDNQFPFKFLRSVKSKFGVVQAIIITSLVFTAIHMQLSFLSTIELLIFYRLSIEI